jgi:hypothetical protein
MTIFPAVKARAACSHLGIGSFRLSKYLPRSPRKFRLSERPA